MTWLVCPLMVIGADAVDVMGVPSVAATTAVPDSVRLTVGPDMGDACTFGAATADTEPRINATAQPSRCTRVM